MMNVLKTLALFVGILLVLPGVSRAQLVLFDDFNLPTINPDKWHGGEGAGGSALAPNGETSRGIVDGQLQLQLTSYGETNSDIGFPPNGGNQRLRINNPGAVTAMQANVTVTSATVEGCPANPDRTRVRAQLHGVFFNDGSSTGAGDQTGDVRAIIEKRRASPAANTIRAIVNRCIDPGCDNNETLASFVFVTGWTLGVGDTLELGWEPDNDQFLFAVNPGTAGEETVALAYTVSDANPPVFDFKHLRVQNNVANCTEARKSASVTALFDDVMLNPEAIP
jgi:hypothetical protein